MPQIADAGASTEGTTTSAAAPVTATPTLIAAADAGYNTLNYAAITSGYGLRVYRSSNADLSGGVLLFELPVGEAAQPAGVLHDTTAPIGAGVYYDATYYNAGTEGARGAIIGPFSAMPSAADIVEGVPSNVASATPSAPLGAVVNLICTAGNMTVGLLWSNPVGTFGRVLVSRRLSVQAGPVNTWVVIATLLPLTPGDSTTIASSYQDTDPALVNGMEYDYEVTPEQ